ncbi:receptor expression-enhancing protein 3-like isoform X1 [Myxocyprinus asiaticus]|uniref:receptor expression-enhancing protein 3-like isoform X1 n=2 Tax=Myxocyprinus asiaticus TaxID=70543 RepID=UPI0022217A26|nr:receptor expression-enhancing protein 3-like isoform X1 [Myxocyprinus asiaticus]
MVSWIISRVIVLVFGTLYPAYNSFKAVKSKNVKEYVRWMMYWIVFALYTVVETITDLSMAWFPLYYELKVAFVIWLLTPYTRGASLIYRKFLHPMLASKEKEIDDYIVQAKERSYETMVNFGRQGLTIAATAAVSAAVKGQGAISERLRSFSIPDLTQIPSDQSGLSNPSRWAIQSANPSSVGSEPYKQEGEGHEEETDGVFSEDEASVQKGLRRSQSVKISRAKAARKEPRYGSLKLKPRRRPLITPSTFDHH